MISPRRVWLPLPSFTAVIPEREDDAFIPLSSTTFCAHHSATPVLSLIKSALGHTYETFQSEVGCGSLVYKPVGFLGGCP